MMDFQNRAKEIQIFSEGNPSRTGRKSKFLGRKSKLNASLSFAESSLIKGLRRPPTAFFLLGRFRPQKRRGVGGTYSLRAVSRSFRLHLGSSSLLEQVKGWRRFRSRILVLVRRLDAIPSDPAAASLIARKREPSTGHPRVMSPGDRGACGKRQEIDPMSGRNASAS
jgi:hypothetical protein